MRIRFLAPLALAAVVGCSGDSTPGLDEPDQLILYSIDGSLFEPGREPKTEEKLHRYPVLGKVEVTDAGKRRELLGALKQGMEESDGRMAACFNPRHAIRVVKDGRTIDYVICFECKQLSIHEGDGKRGKPVTRSPEALFNKHLTDAGITLAPPADGKAE